MVVVLVGLVLLRDAIGASLFKWNHPQRSLSCIGRPRG
jgi:hypothetical protein